MNPAKLGEATVGQYQLASRKSHIALWQHVVSVSHIPAESWVISNGEAIARTLDAMEARSPEAATTINTIAHRTHIAKQLSALHKQQRSEAAQLTRAQQQRSQTEAAARHKRSPRFLPILFATTTQLIRGQRPHITPKESKGVFRYLGALVSFFAAIHQGVVVRIEEESAKLLQEADTSRRLDLAEQAHLKQQHTAQREEIAPTHQLRISHMSNGVENIGIETRQQIINSHILAMVAAQKRGGKLLSPGDLGRLYFSALTHILPSDSPCLQGRGAIMIHEAPLQAIRADAQLLAFGTTIDQAQRETTRLETLWESAPQAVQEQTRRVKHLLEHGFTSAAGQVFNPNLGPIRDAIGTRIAALAQAGAESSSLNFLVSTPVPPAPAMRGAGTVPPAPLLH